MSKKGVVFVKKLISLLLTFVMVFCSVTVGFASASDLTPKITEMYVQLGGTGGTTYNTVIDHNSKMITLALPSTLAGSEAVKKAKITYKATGDVTASVDSIYQDLTNDVVYTVSNGNTQEQYTLSLELLSVQRNYNFDAASLMAANHATKERRNACNHRGGTGSGMWYNYGYAFDENGDAIEEETFGSLTLQTETSGKSLLLSKTKTGGILATTSVDGTSYVASTEVFKNSIKFYLFDNLTAGSDGVVFTIRSSNADSIALVKQADVFKMGYIPNGSTSLTVNEDYVVSSGEWHTLDIVFTQNTYTQSKYTLDVKLNGDYLFTTSGVSYDNDGSVLECVGRLSSPKSGNTYIYTDLSTVGLALIMNSAATGSLKIDDFKLYAQKGSETTFDDTASVYSYEYTSDTDPGVAGGNLISTDAPDEPQTPIVPQKPASPVFDGVLDLGFESDGIGWTMHRVNLVTNPGFENTDGETWKVGSTDQNGSMVYSSDKAYSGSKSAYVAYPQGSNPAIQAGVRDYNSYSINPLSEYRLGMAVIYNPVGNTDYKTALSFKTKSNSGSEVTRESMNYCVVDDMTADWIYAEDYFLSVNSNETKVEMFMPRINGGDAGTYAYFDDVYFGTVSHIVKKDQAGFENESYSGDYLLHLGAYNGLHGKDEVTSIALDAREYRTYTVTAFAAARNGNAKAKLGITFFDADGNELLTKYSSASSLAEWTEQTLTASAPKGTSNMKILLCAEGSGSVMFDHVGYIMEEQTVTSIKETGDISLLLGMTESIDYTLPCYAADIYDMPVEDFDETYQLLGEHVDGISLSGNVISVSQNVPDGTSVTLKVSANALNDEFTLTVVRGFVEITGAKLLTRTSSDITSTYNAYFNSNGVSSPLASDKITWSITPVSQDVTVSSGGIVTVGPNASLGEYNLNVVYNDNNNIRTTLKLEIQKQTESAPVSGAYTPPSSFGVTSSSGGGASIPQASIVTPPQISSIPQFDDVDSTFWAYDAITYFAQKGYVSGDGSGEFKVDNNITRAEFVKILLMVMGVEVSENETPFSDVDGNSWYAGYVSTAYALGIVNGTEDFRFSPDSHITRQDMAVIIHRASSMMDITFDNANAKEFTDVHSISDYAKNAVDVLSANGVINGMTDNTFLPHANATRAQSVQMLHRLITK